MIDLPVDIFIQVIAPLIVSNILHMLIVKYNLFSFINIPLALSLFGKNKSWRGLLILPLLNGLIYPYFSLTENTFGVSEFLVGAFLGLTYALFELPNSLLKRRAGIKPGESAKRNKFFFTLLDKSDSAMGVSLVSIFLFDLTAFEFVALLTVSVLVHFLFSFLLFKGGIKSGF